MHPTLLKLGVITVYSYGVMVAIGFALSTVLIYYRANKFGIDKEKSVDLVVLILISGILGARLLYVLLNFSFYRANPLEAIMLYKGGLVWYGGFICALAITVLYTRLNKMKLWLILDLIAPFAALAQAFGRIGCFLNGCCYGIKVAPGTSFGVALPCESDPRIPVQLISAGVLFVIFALLIVWQNRRRFAGEVALAYFLLYSAKRFIVEFLRGDNPKIFLGLTISQIISAAIFASAITVFIIKRKQWKKSLTISR